MSDFETSAGATAPLGESASVNPPTHAPAVDPDTTDLTVDQADRLRFVTVAFFTACEELGIRSRIQLFRLTDTAAFDAFPQAGLSEVGRQRTLDWDYSDDQSVYVHLEGRAS